MNDRLDALLQKLANGELSPVEAARVNQKIATNPEAQARLRQYSGLRSNLSQLRDVPADQLSRDRLRSRLLADGLKGQSRTGGAGWLWMPVTATALAFLVYYVHLRSTDVSPRLVLSPTEVSGLTSASNWNPSVPAFVAPNPKAPSSAVVASNKPERPRLPASAAEPAKTQRRSHEKGPVAAPPTAPTPESYLADNSVSNSIAPVEMPTPAETVVAADSNEPLVNSPAPSKPESVVLISSDSDEQTGAKQATEETPSNVTVGG
jgi:anti-sigma factor RsiW